MRVKNKAKPVTGFEEGRSASSGSSSLPLKKKKTKTKLDKLDAAKSDLADVLESMIDPAGMVGSEDEDVAASSAKFAKDFKRVRRNILESDASFNADSASRALLKTMFAMNLSLVPIAEQAYRSSKKETAMYALLGLQKQTQELSGELKMLGNIEHQAEFIHSKLLKPLFMAMVQMLLAEMIGLKNSIDTEIGGSKQARRIKLSTDEVTKRIGAFVDGMSDKLRDDISAYLAGDTKFLEKPAPGKGRKRSRD